MRIKKPRDQRIASFMPSGLKIIKANSTSASIPIDLRIIRKAQNNLDLGRSLLMKSKSTTNNNNTESYDIEVLNIPISLTEEEARRFFL
jgi:hypothetical protein